MSVNYYDEYNDELIKVDGDVIYSDLPIGSWIKWDDQNNLPIGYLKYGDIISKSSYPELFALYGSSVPYKADASELSDYENITISTDSSSPTIMSYDGFLTVSATGGPRGIFINKIKVANASPTGELDSATTVVVKKGDTVYFSNWYSNCCRGKFYKKSLIVKAKNCGIPADFMNAVEESVEDATIEKFKTFPYSFNASSNISVFNRKFVYNGNSITWTATHTGRLTLRLLKNGDGYSLYLTRVGSQNALLDSYDNFFGTDSQSAGCTQASITLQAWVKKGDVINLESNLPSTTAWEQTFFCQTGLLAYNRDYD